MKHILLIIGLALSASIPAHANLGDTYADSCARFHSAGVISRADRSISWPWSETYSGATGLWVITEQFINNHCTAMLLTWQPGPYRGNWINENFVWFALNANTPGRTWTEYGANQPGQRAFVTTDGQLYEFVASLLAARTGRRRRFCWGDVRAKHPDVPIIALTNY
jgi:hypothetical protein